MMKRGDLLKAAYLLGLVITVAAIYFHTSADLGEIATDVGPYADTALAMGDAPDPTAPPLLYSTVYHEVATKKRNRPRLYCDAALVLDHQTGEILYGKNENKARSIASLTKLMTAMVYLDTKPDLTKKVTITKEDARNSARSHLRRGETFVAIDLFHSALMSSDNRAARAISRASGLSKAEFVRRMNLKANELGMWNTQFVEVTGLAEENISTAYDCALLLDAALEYELIREITTTQRYAFRSLDRRKRLHRSTNSNRLIFSRHKIHGGKTGYICESGWCLATRAGNKKGHEVTAVILGSTSNPQRFRDADRALTWGYRNGK